MVRGISRRFPARYIISDTDIEVGAAKYREMRRKGETVFPPAIVLDRGTSFSIPSRDVDREIPCRFMVPRSDKKPKAVFMHIHGGGFVLGSELESGIEKCSVLEC